MKRLCLLLLVMLTLLPIGAQIRGNSIVVTVEPDHQDWNYQLGETAKFTVEVRRSGTLVNDVTIDYATGPEMYQDGKKTVTLKDGRTIKWVFNYISPSFWLLKGDDFHFGGLTKDTFRMEVIEGDQELELAQKIINLYRNGIDRDTKYHLDALTPDLLQWSLTYPDGHSDTWKFYRK